MAPTPQPDLAEAVLGPAQVTIFENLYAAYAVEAQAMARAFLGDSALAADAVHNAFLELLRLLLSGRWWPDEFEARSAVLRNTRWAALKLLRNRRRRAELAARAIGARDESPDAAAWAQSEARALCEQIVAQLRPDYQAAIRARFIDHLTSADAARRLRISLAAYETRLSRALKEARLIARSLGVHPALVLTLAARDRVVSLRRLIPARQAIGALVPISTAALAACVMAAGIELAADAASQIRQEGVASRAVALHIGDAEVGDPSETPEDTVLEAVFVEPDPGSNTVVIRGFGKRCNCQALFRSADGGANWLGISGSAGPLVGASEAALHVCAEVLGGVACGGHMISGLTGDERLTAGAVAVIGASRMLYLIPSGGIFCSSDGGSSWQTRCS